MMDSTNNSQQFTIREVPRSTSNVKAGMTAKKVQYVPKPIKWTIIAPMILAMIIFAALSFGIDFSSVWKNAENAPRDPNSTNSRIDMQVTKHLQDAELKRSALVQKRELENVEFQASASQVDTVLSEVDPNAFGVQLDNENTAERLYEDLNESEAVPDDLLPDERVNARLANRRWINEMERQERVQYLTNFIRAAHERGYELQIDQNLVVVGVKRIRRTQKVNISQVLDKIAAPGL